MSGDFDTALARLRTAVDDLEDAAEGDADDDHGDCCCDVDHIVIDELTESVRRAHDDSHDGPMQFCSNEVCKKAFELLP